MVLYKEKVRPHEQQAGVQGSGGTPCSPAPLNFLVYCLMRSKLCYTETTMASIQWLINKPINIPIVASYLLSLALVVTPAALASYVPPSDQKPVPSGTRTGAATTRGCNTEEMSFTLLAPRNHVGQTISQRPTFAWFFPDSGSFEVKFAIYELVPGGNPKEIYTKPLQR